MKRTVAEVLEIGREQLAARAELRGHFGEWIVRDLRIHPTTARMHMQAARRFGGQTEEFPRFAPSVLYELAEPSTPDAAAFNVRTGGPTRPRPRARAHDVGITLGRTRQRRGPRP